MKTIKNLLLVGGLAGSLAFSGCKENNQKYQDFANFVMREGSFFEPEKGSQFGEFHLACYSLKNGVDYGLRVNKNKIEIFRYGKKTEIFRDNHLNGLDNYLYFVGNSIVYEIPSKENKQKYEMLIDSIPKWYAECKEE